MFLVRALSLRCLAQAFCYLLPSFNHHLPLTMERPKYGIHLKPDGSVVHGTHGSGLSQDMQSVLMRMMIVSAVNKITGQGMEDSDYDYITGGPDPQTHQEGLRPVHRPKKFKLGTFGKKQRMKRGSKRRAPKF